MTLHRQSVRAIGRNELGLVRRPVDFGMGTTWAKCHVVGKLRESQISLKSESSLEREVEFKCCTIVYVMRDGPGLVPLQDFRARRSSFNVNSELYSRFPMSSVAKSGGVCSERCFMGRNAGG